MLSLATEYITKLPIQIDIGLLKKARAQFELRPLDSPEFPTEAITCSANAFNGLYFLASENEINMAASKSNLPLLYIWLLTLTNTKRIQIATRTVGIPLMLLHFVVQITLLIFILL